MSQLSSKPKPRFSRIAGGYDPSEVSDYVIRMQSQLRGDDPEAQVRPAQQRPEKSPSENAAASRRLHPVPDVDEDSTMSASPADGASAPEEPAAPSPLDELTSERDRLMSEISNLMTDLNSIERQRATMLGASMADPEGR